jgi:hypothetical protein
MAGQSRDPFAPPGDDVPRVELASDTDGGQRGKKSLSGTDPFAPPTEGEALDLALEIAKPNRRPTQQTVAEPTPQVRSLTAERSSAASGIFRLPPPAKTGSSGTMRAPDSGGVSGVHRMPEGNEPAEYKAPREGMSNLLLWAFAGLGLLAVIGSAVRFLRSGPKDAAVATGAAAPGTQAAAPEPTVWKPVELGPNVLVTIDVSPRSARLLLDGEPMVSNPVALPRGTKHTIGALADGFEGSLTTVVADKRKTVRVVLRPARRSR